MLKQIALLIVGLLTLSTGSGHCQGAASAAVQNWPSSWADSSAKSVAAAFRAGMLDVTKVLRQEVGAVQRSRLDAVADSLVSIAIGAPGSPVDIQLRDRAIHYLSFAGGKNTEGFGGVRYAGAVERLIRIGRAAPDAATRRTVNGNLLQAGPPEQVVGYLIGEARSKDPGVAGFAMAELTHYLESSSLTYKQSSPGERDVVRTALRNLWDEARRPGQLDLVIPDPLAQRSLSRTVMLEKWPGFTRNQVEGGV